MDEKAIKLILAASAALEILTNMEIEADGNDDGEIAEAESGLNLIIENLEDAIAQHSSIALH